MSACLHASALAFVLYPLLHAAAPATPPFRIGLNAPFVGNNSTSITDQVTSLRELGVVGLRHIDPCDAGWSMVQLSSGLFNFTNSDSMLSGSNAQGFGFLPTFYGEGDENCYVPPGTASTESWSAATYGTQTTTYLQTVVTRYKSNVHYWEIANEMDGKTTPPAGFTPAGYAEFLNYSASAIRAADPNATIVIAGTVGGYGYPMSIATQWLTDVLDAGGATGFDVFNYHDYKSWWTLPTHYDQYRAILDAHNLNSMPIWVSETAQSSVMNDSHINPAYASVDGQAADTWRRPCLLFGKGAQAVMWHSYWDNSADTSGFRNMGLVNASTGIRKKSWHSFQLLNQKIEGFTSATLVSQGTVTDDNTNGGNGIWIVRFDFADGSHKWVAWSPDGQPATLTGLTGATSVSVKSVVPTSLSADGLTPTWNTSTATVSSDQVTLTLADIPVLIEIPTSYSLWTQSKFTASELADTSVSGPSADTDGDGIVNLLEYAFGTDPKSATSSSVWPDASTATSSSDGLSHLVLTASLSATPPDLDAVVEVSSDMQTWLSGSAYTETVSDNTSAGVRTLTVRDKTAMTSSEPKHFMRLKISTH